MIERESVHCRQGVYLYSECIGNRFVELRICKLLQLVELGYGCGRIRSGHELLIHGCKLLRREAAGRVEHVAHFRPIGSAEGGYVLIRDEAVEIIAKLCERDRAGDIYARLALRKDVGADQIANAKLKEQVDNAFGIALQILSETGRRLLYAVAFRRTQNQIIDDGACDGAELLAVRQGNSSVENIPQVDRNSCNTAYHIHRTCQQAAKMHKDGGGNCRADNVILLLKPKIQNFVKQVDQIGGIKMIRKGLN